MPRRLKRRWIRALKSGRYKQGKGKLRTQNTWCCLGVLCDIHPEVEWKEHRFGDGLIFLAGYGDDSHNDVRLPTSLREELGIDLDAQNALMRMNDGMSPYYHHPHNFKEIAQWIKKNL